MPATRPLAEDPSVPSLPADSEVVEGTEPGAPDRVSLTRVLAGNGVKLPRLSTGK